MARLSLTLILLVGVCAGALAFSYDRQVPEDASALDVAADGSVLSVEQDEDMMMLNLPMNPEDVLRLPKCKNGECRKKCNDKGENGACAWRWCVCWK